MMIVAAAAITTPATKTTPATTLIWLGIHFDLPSSGTTSVALTINMRHSTCRCH